MESNTTEGADSRLLEVGCLSAVVLHSGGLRSRHIFKLVRHACMTKHPITQNIFNSGFYKNGEQWSHNWKNGSPYIWAINSTLPYKRSLYCSDFQKTKWSVGTWFSSVFLIIVLTNTKNEILGQRGNVKYSGSLLGYKIRQRWLKIEPYWATYRNRNSRIDRNPRRVAFPVRSDPS